VGDAEFLVAAAQRLEALGTPNHRATLSGHEIHPESAQEARQRLREIGVAPEITVGDFFDEYPTPTATAVIGNPPYIRYQSFSGFDREKAQQAALSAGVRPSGLASSWAAFVVHSSRFLRPDGRLGLVLPAELLHVGYAGPVRSYLLSRFESVRIVVFDELVFPDVTSEVVLLLAEGTGPSSEVEVVHARDVADLVREPTEPYRWHPPTPEGKWSSALVDQDALASFAKLQDPECSRRSLIGDAHSSEL
jgi:adenine-specific DNA methylase